MTGIDKTQFSPVHPAVDQNLKGADSKNSLQQDDFMKLLVTQMSQQDPMDPQDPGSFLGQLAQFGTVTGIGELNKTVSSLQSGMFSNQALQASSLVGRHVQIPSNKALLSPDGGLSGAIDLEGPARDVKISVISNAGEIVKQFDLGPHEQGTVEFKWDGTGDDGTAYQPGLYQIRADAQLANQNNYTGMQTFAVANVESVTIGQDERGVLLNLAGLGSISMDDVSKIS